MDRHPTTEPFYGRVRSDLASNERLVEQLRGEVFDLKLIADGQAADLKKLRGCEAERDEYAEELLKTEEELQQQAPRLERAEMRVAILEASWNRSSPTLALTQTLTSRPRLKLCTSSSRR